MGNKTTLKAIPFSDISIWDIKNYFRHVDTFNEKHPLVFFGEFLSKPDIEKTKIEDTKEYKILGVRSYGRGVYINRIVKGDTLKMRTYQIAKKNHLFWCKVDTKNGAFGIIKDEHAQGVASSNMTFAEINEQKANIDFIQLLFLSKKVNQYMDGYVTGTTNRKYIKPNQLLNEIKISLPSLEVQNRVVANYNAKIQLAERQEAQAERLEEEIERYLFEELGVRKIEDKEIKTGLHFLNYSEIVNWNIDNKDISLFKSSKYEITSILMDTSLADDVFRGKSPKYDSNGNSIILNQKCNRWNHIQIKYAKNVNDKWYASIDEKFFTKENDILINSTGEGTIGRATYMDRNNESLLYDSHILLLRFDISKVNPLFYTYLFNSTYGQKQVEQIKSAQSTKQTELGVSNLKKIVFPIPPLNIQKSIANYIAQLKDQIKSLQTQAKENRTQATVEFEGEIFTTQ